MLLPPLPKARLVVPRSVEPTIAAAPPNLKRSRLLRLDSGFFILFLSYAWLCSLNSSGGIQPKKTQRGMLQEPAHGWELPEKCRLSAVLGLVPLDSMNGGVTISAVLN